MNMYKGHMDKTKVARIKSGRWGSGGKMKTTVLEQ